MTVYHKNVATGNVVRCNQEIGCQVSNIHGRTASETTSLWDSSEKTVKDFDKLSYEDAVFLVERKKIESTLLDKEIENIEAHIHMLISLDNISSQKRADVLVSKRKWINDLRKKAIDDWLDVSEYVETLENKV